MMNSTMSLNHRRHDEEGHQLTGAYTSKPPKQWPLRPVHYLLKEQRLIFILVGIVIATAFFVLQPSLMSQGQRQEYTKTAAAKETHLQGYVRPHRQTPLDVDQQNALDIHPVIISSGGKIPLGLKSKSLRIVVTGGAGFVGSHLVDRLMDRGDSVIVIDNFFTGRKENVYQHIGNPRFELIRHDVVEPILLEVDQIYHLACPASPVHYKFNPVKTIISSS